MKISEEFADDYRDETTRGAANRGECPSAEVLSRLATGDLADPERSELLDHVAGCADCAVELRMAKEVASWSEESLSDAGDSPQAEPASDAGPVSRFPWWIPAAVAALLAVAIGLGLILPTWTTDEARVRGEITAVKPAEGADLTEPPARLQWPAQPGAEGYRVTILDDQGQTLWQGPWSDEPFVRPIWPGAVQGTYLWTVDVRGSVSRQKLGPYVFRVSDSP